MHYRFIAVLTIACLAWQVEGCTNKWNSNSENMLMPLQTGSLLHRPVWVAADQDKKPKEKKTKEKKAKEPATRKPEAEPNATPTPEEENTPPADRFR